MNNLFGIGSKYLIYNLIINSNTSETYFSIVCIKFQNLFQL